MSFPDVDFAGAGGEDGGEAVVEVAGGGVGWDGEITWVGGRRWVEAEVEGWGNIAVEGERDGGDHVQGVEAVGGVEGGMGA